jgi:hypothetical protein
VRDIRHDSASLFGAICRSRGVGATIIMLTINTEAMSEHLKDISTQATAGAHCILICGGAGWHQNGGELAVPDTITLFPLPPYVDRGLGQYEEIQAEGWLWRTAST